MATLGGTLETLQPPPRSVPFTIMVSSFLGGAATQAAWFILLVVLVPIWYVARNDDIDPMDSFAFRGATAKVTGIVTGTIDGKSQTVSHIGRDGAGYEHYLERIEVLGIQYIYNGPNGNRRVGNAYGLSQDDVNRLTVGVSIPIEYSRRKPEISRYKSFRSEASHFPPFMRGLFWISIIATVLSAPIALVGLAKGFRIKRLLTDGILTYAELTASDPVPFGESRNLRRFTLSFHDGVQDVNISTISSDHESELASHDDPVFYDPRNSSSAIVVRQIPGHLEVDENGCLTEGLFNPYNYLWFPVICAMVYGWFVLDLLGISSPPGL